MDIQELLTNIGDTLSVRRSFGAAYERDGLLVIPVALVAGGGGGGGESGVLDEQGSGAGVGFGGVVVPMGVYVARDDEVRWVPAWDALFLLFAAFGVLRFVGRTFARKRRR